MKGRPGRSPNVLRTVKPHGVQSLRQLERGLADGV